jgi:hypothetical protein
VGNSWLAQSFALRQPRVVVYTLQELLGSQIAPILLGPANTGVSTSGGR